MIDDFKTGLSLAKGVVELAKGLRDLSEKSDDLEIREAAAELRSKTIDLKETVNEMRDQIIDLQGQLSFKRKLAFNGKVFEYEDNGVKRYICNGCISDGKYVHMSEANRTNGGLNVFCPVCKNNRMLIEGEPIRRH